MVNIKERYYININGDHGLFFAIVVSDKSHFKLLSLKVAEFIKIYRFNLFIEIFITLLYVMHHMCEKFLISRKLKVPYPAFHYSERRPIV